MRKKLNIILALQLFSLCVFAQVNQEWVQRYNSTGDGTDEAKSIALDASGNVYVAGYTYINSNLSYVVIKYNPAGVQLWSQTYATFGGLNDEAPCLAVDASGNIIIAGRVWAGPPGFYNFLVVKYNNAGVQQWFKTYNGPGNIDDIVSDIATDMQENVYITGAAWGSGTSRDYTTIKYNSAGVQQWIAIYNRAGGSTDELTEAISVDASGNVYVTGSSTDSPHRDYATVKYNSSGIQQWAVTYNGVGNSQNVAKDIAIDASGNVYVTGSSSNFGTNLDYLTIKYNASGIQQWYKRYNGPVSLSDEAVALSLDNTGNICVTGFSDGGSSGQDFVTVKYTSDSVQLWLQRYNGPGNGTDNTYALTIDSSGSVYITGNSKGTTIQGEYATIKYNSSGVQQWEQRYEGPGSGGGDYPYAIAVDGQGNVYVTGMSYGSSSFQDFATIKYSQPIGIHNISGEIPEEYSLSQNYPNPFNPVTNIKFEVSSAGFIKLVVFDILGREIQTLVNEKLNAGTYNVDWNASHYSSGVYFYKLEAGDFIETRKMILIK